MSQVQAKGLNASNADRVHTVAHLALRTVCLARQDLGRARLAPFPAASVLRVPHLSLPQHPRRARAHLAVQVSSAVLKAAQPAALAPLVATALTPPSMVCLARLERIRSIRQQAAARRVSLVLRVITARQMEPFPLFRVSQTVVVFLQFQALKTTTNV